MELQPGTTIGNYRIESVRARGGMGIVYEATHTALGVRRALKVIAPALADDPKFRERFKRESQLAASIEHPNVIAIHDSGESQGVLYIAMGFVEGTDLRELVSRTGPLDPRRATYIVGQIASALDAAHRAGLVHRDVKPANVLIVDEGVRDHALLTDFGLTKHASSATGLTNTGQWVGTADFVAPEQLDGRPVDARTDVYALAGVLYYTLTGDVPYPRDNDVGKLFAHMNESPPSLPRAHEPPWSGLDAVIKRAMAKSPDERYQAAGELGRAASVAVGAAGVETPHPPDHAPVVADPATHVGPTLGNAPQPVAPAYGGPPTTAPPPRPPPPPPPPAPRYGPQPTGGGRPQRRGGVPMGALVGGGAAALALIVIALFAFGVIGGGDEKSAEPIAVGNGAEALEINDGTVWVANLNDGSLSRVDAETREVEEGAIRVGKDPSAMAFSDEDVWVANSGDGTVSRIDKSTNEVVATIKVGGNPDNVRVGDGAVWVHPYSTEIVAIDPGTNKVVESSRLTFEEGLDISFGASGYWVLALKDKELSPYDVQADDYSGDPIELGGDPLSVLPLEGAVLVYHRDGTMTHIDPKTKKIVGERFEVGDDILYVDVRAGSIWVTVPIEGVVKRFDLQTHEPIGEPIEVGRGVGAAQADDEVLWVTNSDRDTLTPVEVDGLETSTPEELEINDAFPERFDPPAAESALEQSLDGGRLEGSVVNCPNDATPSKGDTITCQARARDGGDPCRGPIRVRVRDNAGSDLAYRGKLEGADFTTTVRGNTTVP